MQSIFCYQYNTVVCYIFIFAFILLEKNKPFWAVLLIMISATTKVYGLAELALLFCYPKVWRNFGYAILCGVALLMLPALNPHVDSLSALYQGTLDMINDHHSSADYIGILFARGLKPLLLPNYRIVQMGVLAILGILFFWRHKRWQDFADFKQNYEVPQSLVDEVLAEGDRQKIKPKDDAELEKTLPYLRLQLKALIARDLWDMSEYFSVFNERSEIVKKALEVIGSI
jgi:hypothetical protein